MGGITDRAKKPGSLTLAFLFWLFALKYARISLPIHMAFLKIQKMLIIFSAIMAANSQVAMLSSIAANDFFLQEAKLMVS